MRNPDCVLSRKCLVALAALALLMGRALADDGESLRDRVMRRLKGIKTPPTATSAPVQGLTENFTINAQYRGTVKKGFPDIGGGSITYLPMPGGHFKILCTSNIEDPDSHKKYSIKLDMEYALVDQRLTIVARHNTYNKNADEYRDNIERAIPFVYLAKYGTPPQPGQEPTRVFNFKGTDFTLRYVETERHEEATLYDGDQTVGKFFILRENLTPPVSFEKFRVPEGDVVLSFVIRP